MQMRQLERYLTNRGEEAREWILGVLNSPHLYDDFELRLDPEIQGGLADYFNPDSQGDGLYKFAEQPLADCITTHQIEWAMVSAAMQKITASGGPWGCKHKVVCSMLGSQHPIAQIVRGASKERAHLVSLAQAIEQMDFSTLTDALVSYQLGLRYLGGKPVPGIKIRRISSAPSSEMFLPNIGGNGWYQMIYEARTDDHHIGEPPKYLWTYMQCHIEFMETPYTASLLFPIATDAFSDAPKIFEDWARGDLVRGEFEQLSDHVELLKRPEFSSINL
jgi:hypothetical protein